MNFAIKGTIKELTSASALDQVMVVLDGGRQLDPRLPLPLSYTKDLRVGQSVEVSITISDGKE